MNENNWRYWYKAAVLELNSSLVQIRVNEALAAINARAAAGARVPRDELRDMRAAMSTLREMKSRQEVTRAPLMASWLLDCKNCSKPFVYSLIPDRLADYHLPSRPVFPAVGRERECPHCKTKSTYQQTDLRFQNSPVR
jgi:hypothetical protein